MNDESSDEIMNRADDYEERLAEAGGGDAIIDGLVRGLKRQKNISRILILFVFIKLAIIGFVIANSYNINKLQDRTSDEVLCPLYTLFLDLIEDAPLLAADEDENGKISAKEKRKYDNTVRVFYEGYATLECQPLRELVENE